MTALSPRSLASRIAAASLLAGLAGLAGWSCQPGVATQVMVNIDLQPGLRDLATAVEARVFDGDGRQRGYQRLESAALGRWPLRLPLVPEGGDASRTWLVEVSVRHGDDDQTVGFTRARGGYEANALRSALVCVYDGCATTGCRREGQTCLMGSPCETCVAGSCRPVPARAALEPGDAVLRCPGSGASEDAGSDDGGGRDASVSP